MSVGFRHRHDHGSGYIQPQEMVAADDDLLERVNIDRTHDVPFCAGMSEDGETLYIDKEVPEEIDGMVLSRPLVIHEMIEHLLMDDLGLKYEEAHYVATAAEEACVRCLGYDLAKYNKAWDKIIRKVGSRAHYDNVPDDLDTEPYQDEEKDDPGDENAEQAVTSAHKGLMNGDD